MQHCTPVYVDNTPETVYVSSIPNKPGSSREMVHWFYMLLI